ncbi:flagellar hook-basal body complex protein FliE [Sphingomonas sp. HT-1]|uniref:flagellar hook-basal body complex protein FliE n=1 Tax=unclassified Sphingomonas TaxID=196159 RepID=UPI0002E65B37|nr:MULTISPECIES: flagellar hook-basal body complex protein FliE [unclassified Sphingomonas]KTF70610.1 flagellar hook-basal body protein FliE [Sphingomonas sp. WG]
MSIGALDATKAYGRVASLGDSLGKASDTGETGGASGFGAMVENLVGGTADKLRSAEAASAKQVAGKGDLIDVVTAIGAAETALDTMVAVRDRVVGAYTDIMRMQI